MTGKSNNNNMILAIALSALVIIGWQYFVVGPQMKAEQAKQAAIAKQEKLHPHTVAPSAPGAAPSVPGMASASTHMSRDAALKASGARVTVTVFPRQAGVGDLTREILTATNGWQVEELRTEEGRLDEVFRSLTLPDTKN